MEKKQVKFDPGNIQRLGKKGTCEDDKDSAFRKLLDLDDDVERCLRGNEPETEKIKELKEKWKKIWCKNGI
jgi:hypothetical protein